MALFLWIFAAMAFAVGCVLVGFAMGRLTVEKPVLPEMPKAESYADYNDWEEDEFNKAAYGTGGPEGLEADK